MVACEQAHCTEFMFDEDAAVRVGWAIVEGQWFCAFCAPMATLNSRRAAQVGAQRQMSNASAARRLLNAEEYRAWDEFQSDLANFHRDHGKLAPAELRAMRPGEWVQGYRAVGRIDVEKSAENFEKLHKEQEATRERIARG